MGMFGEHVECEGRRGICKMKSLDVDICQRSVCLECCVRSVRSFVDAVYDAGLRRVPD
jgi:hypothetical protein